MLPSKLSRELKILALRFFPTYMAFQKGTVAGMCVNPPRIFKQGLWIKHDVINKS